MNEDGIALSRRSVDLPSQQPLAIGLVPHERRAAPQEVRRIGTLPVLAVVSRPHLAAVSFVESEPINGVPGSRLFLSEERPEYVSRLVRDHWTRVSFGSQEKPN